MSTKISEIFDVEPIPQEPKQFPLAAPVEDPSNSEVDDDVEFARQNIKEILRTGMEAMETANQIASESESPRAFEVLSTMMKTLGDMNSQLIDLHEKKKKAKGMRSSDETPTRVTNNYAFVGTPAELNKLNMERKKQ